MHERDWGMVVAGAIAYWGIRMVSKIFRLWKEPEPPVVVAVLSQIIDTQQIIVRSVDNLAVRVEALEAR